jgi:VWFA-related protein
MKIPSVIASIVGLLPLLAAAQETQPSAASPVFGETVEVRVVNLEVVVTDRDGVPVTGLAPGDFELLVDGKELPVRYFSEVRSGTAVAAESSAGEAIGGVPDVVPGEPVGTSYLVFIDDYFSLGRDRDRVLTSLREQSSRLRPEDRMAIVAFDGKGLTMLTSWTNAPRELERAFRDAAARPAYGLQRLSERRTLNSERGARTGFLPGVEASRTSALDTRLDVAERYYAETLEQQLSRAVTAAAAAIRSFANPPGRKVMLVLAGGWPFEIDDYVSNQFGRIVSEPGLHQGAELYAPLVDAANQTGYTLFTVDVPGLGSDSLSGADQESIPADSDRFASFLGENNTQYTLERVARETGGEALLNARRLQALERAEAVTRTYYWLGFVPTWQGDDKSHRVEVRVRREGLRTSSRGGYVDFSRRSEVSAAVESVLLFGSGPGTRTLDLTVGKPESARGRTMKVPITLSIPVEGLTLLPDAQGKVAELELRVAASDDSGGISEIPVIPLRLELPPEPPAGSRARYQTTIELRRAKNHLAVAVYDPVSGALWTATADVHP